MTIDDLAERLEARGHADLATRLDVLAELSTARKPEQVKRDRAERAEEAVDLLRQHLHTTDDPENRQRILDELQDREQQLDRYGPDISPPYDVDPGDSISDDYVGLPNHVTRAGMPTVQQTNEKAQQSLPLLPREVRALMTRLHGLEARSGSMVRHVMQRQEAERVWRTLDANLKKAWGIGSVDRTRDGIVYDSDAGSLVLTPPPKKSKPWVAHYTTQTKRVWE